MMHELTEHQKKFAEENHNLVLDFLRYNQLSSSEYYDVLALGYLSAVQVYHEDSRTRKFEFTTIASRKMSDSLFDYWRYNSRLKRKAYLVDLNGNVYEDRGIYRKGDWDGMWRHCFRDLWEIIPNAETVKTSACGAGE